MNTVCAGAAVASTHQSLLLPRVNCLLHSLERNASRGGCSCGPEEPRRGRTHTYEGCCSEATPALSPRQLPQGSRQTAERDEPETTIYYSCSKQSLHSIKSVPDHLAFKVKYLLLYKKTSCQPNSLHTHPATAICQSV